METPCIKTCLYDRARQLCAGCGRTLDEITGWEDMDEAERRRVMAELPARLTALKPD